jgi:hypothetical protein
MNIRYRCISGCGADHVITSAPKVEGRTADTWARMVAALVRNHHKGNHLDCLGERLGSFEWELYLDTTGLNASELAVAPWPSAREEGQDGNSN